MACTAFMVESGFVPLESFIHATPSFSRTNSILCSTPGNSLSPRLTPSASSPWLMARHIAHSAFSILCLPGILSSLAAIRSVSLPSMRNIILPFLINAPFSGSVSCEK